MAETSVRRGGKLHRRPGAALVPLFVAVAGCYGYYPAQATAIPPGEPVRAVLSDRGANRVSRTVMGDRQYVEGDLVDLDEDTATLSVWIGQAYRGTSFEETREIVAFPREEISGFQVRELSRGRTALVAAGVVGFVVYLIDQLPLTIDPNNDDDDGEPPPPLEVGLPGLAAGLYRLLGG